MNGANNIYGAQVNRKCTRSEPEVGQKWNARDLQASNNELLFARNNYISGATSVKTHFKEDLGGCK